MSLDPKLILQHIPPGSGTVLDLGGGDGKLGPPLEHKGYRYINLDMRSRGDNGSNIIGDAHALPFSDSSFELIVSKDTLEHFTRPELVVREVGRVLAQDGRFVILVPFMLPFHGDDTYRYTPLGIRYLLTEVAALEIESITTPLGLLSVLCAALEALLSRVGLSAAIGLLRSTYVAIDTRLAGTRGGASAFAAAYLIVARKRRVDS